MGGTVPDLLENIILVVVSREDEDDVEELVFKPSGLPSLLTGCEMIIFKPGTFEKTFICGILDDTWTPPPPTLLQLLPGAFIIGIKGAVGVFNNVCDLFRDDVGTGDGVFTFRSFKFVCDVIRFILKIS
jgi:hypothetical protein